MWDVNLFLFYLIFLYRWDRDTSPMLCRGTATIRAAKRRIKPIIDIAVPSIPIIRVGICVISWMAIETKNTKRKTLKTLKSCPFVFGKASEAQWISPTATPMGIRLRRRAR